MAIDPPPDALHDDDMAIDPPPDALDDAVAFLDARELTADRVRARLGRLLERLPTGAVVTVRVTAAIVEALLHDDPTARRGEVVIVIDEPPDAIVVVRVA